MKRIQSVDIFRVIAVVMVITLHTSPFRTVSAGDNSVWAPYLYKFIFVGINNLARFAVPFFFVISGYFWGNKIRNGNEPKAYSLMTIKRLFFVFLFWNLIYLFPYNKLGFHTSSVEILTSTIQNIHIIFDKPISVLIMQGTRDHLWFLVSLMFSMGTCAILVPRASEIKLVAFSFVLYVLGILATTSYANTPIGIRIPYVEFHIPNNSIGPFFSSIFFVSGYLMSGLKINNEWLIYGFLVFFIGCVIQFFEIYILYKFYGGNLMLEFGLGTFFMGNGIAMVSLSDHPLLQSNILSKIGQMVLGIYAVHNVFVDLFHGIPHTPTWEVGYAVVVFAFSLLLTYFMSKYEPTKKLVM